MRQPSLVLERLFRKEAEHGAHLVDAPLAEEALDLKGLDDHPRRLRDRRDPRPGAQRAATGDDLLEQRPGAVEVAEEQVRLRRERAAHEGGEPAAGLEGGLHQHAERHRGGAVLLEVPRSLGHVVLDLDAAARPHGAHLRVDIDFDDGLVWCENRLLAKLAPTLDAERPRGLAELTGVARMRRWPKEKPSTDATGFGSTWPTSPPSARSGTGAPVDCVACGPSRAQCSRGQSGTSRRPTRRAWKALSPSTVQSRSANSVGIGPEWTSETKTS
jgi:hypothetical protein